MSAPETGDQETVLVPQAGDTLTLLGAERPGHKQQPLIISSMTGNRKIK